MQDLTILFFCLGIGIFLARYAIKNHGGVDFLSACISIGGLVLVLQDPTIPENQLLVCAIPMILIIMLTLGNLAWGSQKDRF